MREHLLDDGAHLEAVSDKRGSSEIVAIIPDRALLAAPEPLETQEAFVIRRRPAEVHRFEPLFPIPSQGFPEDEVVRTQPLIGSVRSAILVDRTSSKVKKNRRGDTLPGKESRDDGAEISTKDMVKDLFEEQKGLGRKSVAFSGQAVETIKGRQGIQGSIDRYG